MNTNFLWGTSNTKMLEITIPENSAHDDEGTNFFELDRWILQVLLYTVVRPAFWIWGEKTLFISFNVIYPQSLLGEKNVHCKPIPVMKAGFSLWSFSHREKHVILRGRSQTMFTRFGFFWPPTPYRDPCNENRVPCNENRFFHVRKTSQGKPCFHYRDGFAVHFI